MPPLRRRTWNRYRRKIQWMIDHQPALPQVPAEYQDIVQLAWPEALILRRSRFVGFAMRKIDFDRTLELDYLLNRRQSARKDSMPITASW